MEDTVGDGRYLECNAFRYFQPVSSLECGGNVDLAFGLGDNTSEGVLDLLKSI